jgi:signal transduction histidine kinase
VIGAMRRPSVIDATEEVMSRLEQVERTLERLPEGPERAVFTGDVAALREALQRLEGLERDERHQLGHDLRVPLNAIAGWTHILRIDAAPSSTVARAVDVFDRNARALTRVIETYTAEVER